MIVLDRVVDLKFEFNLFDSNVEFIEQRNQISKILDSHKDSFMFMSNLLVKVNNTFLEIFKETNFDDDSSAKSNFELIRRVVNNFVFSNRMKLLVENYNLISNSFKELNMFLSRHKSDIEQEFDKSQIDFFRALIIELYKLEY